MIEANELKFSTQVYNNKLNIYAQFQISNPNHLLAKSTKFAESVTSLEKISTFSFYFDFTNSNYQKKIVFF